jgi:hypothetical protein
VVIRKKRKKKKDALTAVFDAATNVVDSRRHAPTDGNLNGRCMICNERWPCFQQELKVALANWKEVNA